MFSQFSALPEEFVPQPPSSIHHIIWNVVITDKLTTLTQEIIEQNKINHILAILPDTDDFLSLNTDIPSVPYDVLSYGKNHDTNIDFDIYDKYSKKIDDIAKISDIRNVLIFCNNGFQRSLPFIVYYLNNFHSNEVPTIEKAVELVLSQIDKENYTKIKDDMVINMKKLLQP